MIIAMYILGILTMLSIINTLLLLIILHKSNKKDGDNREIKELIKSFRKEVTNN